MDAARSHRSVMTRLGKSVVGKAIRRFQPPALIETSEARRLLTITSPVVRINYLDTVQTNVTPTNYVNLGQEPAPSTLTWLAGVPLFVTGVDAMGEDQTQTATGTMQWGTSGFKAVDWSGTIVDGETSGSSRDDKTGNTCDDTSDDAPILAQWQWNFGDPTHAYNSLDGFDASHIFTYDSSSAATNNHEISLTVTNSAGLRRQMHRAF